MTRIIWAVRSKSTKRAPRLVATALAVKVAEAVVAKAAEAVVAGKVAAVVVMAVAVETATVIAGATKPTAQFGMETVFHPQV